jgi:hypothetical protein
LSDLTVANVCSTLSPLSSKTFFFVTLVTVGASKLDFEKTIPSWILLPKVTFVNKVFLFVMSALLCVSPHNNSQQTQEIWVDAVTNKIQIGSLAGNRNLEFGVRNIVEEFLQEKDYDLNPNAKNKLSVELVYLDVLKTKSNISVFHKNEESVVIRLKGILKNDNKKIKEVIVEEESSEISMSTLIVDNGGKFNQTSLSNAIKKASDKLVNKIFETK